MEVWEIALGVVVGGVILIVLFPTLVSLRTSLAVKVPATSSRAWRRSVRWIKSKFRPGHWSEFTSFAQQRFTEVRDRARSVSVAAWIFIVLFALIVFGLISSER